ncbi:L51/S25/CI-B8 domain-containing protein [Aspergillus luchuensis]|uniref:Ribosomal protein/NADH dehydrogenase domain-containing protein n=10 Tax=Aspergillus subgen. Circumdati TaxID=2720871 RepID=A0A1L9MTD0_ASPTC|nr:NADH-ubiquinone oxidoreductase 105 kDa subunit [Aspergillus eucalypticola CBS 122712]XP_025474142.1 NADH-ubiquinone oxidoreductase 105 kDa subunit [Aspergillus neoniger CBS 115656]XP_025517055.1 NADH-ubiquinone oxidoreductase 105 kDa subunit [Aspergillus piperis CBS 112811]XP_025540038.1 NADH-ubiquinone oxidoreductase 105 kDa subunit [Aspergillus costaricaensis CBS 115574]XP_025564849.1 NADH-ubiquinone oxidoreductase 105 kDa subunit [Aspergillus vadensis CBS 113365]XP_035352483.1 NADH dehyd
MSSKYVFTKGLKELRFLFCQTSQASSATRSFLQRAYPTMKKHNPHTPILMREAAGTVPRVYARYAFGQEKQEALTGLTDQQIEEKITQLVKASS